jgi:hypothetical protein
VHSLDFIPTTFGWDSTYDMGRLELKLMTLYGVSLRIRGVMYRLREAGGLPGLHESIIFQDGLGDYYFRYQDGYSGFLQFVAKFRAPCGTAPEEFVEKYFKGAIKGVDMDEVVPLWDMEDNEEYYKHADRVRKEQSELAKLWQKAQCQSACACAKLRWAR